MKMELGILVIDRDHMTEAFHLETHMHASLNRRIFIAASSHWLEPLRVQLAGLPSEIRLIEIEPGGDLPDDLLHSAELLVLEVPYSSAGAMRQLARFRNSNPETPVIAALENGDLATMRALMQHDVRHVVGLPFETDELLSQLVEAGANSRREEKNHLAPLVSFTAGGGGSGATSILINLAAALVQEFASPKTCCIIDLDLQFGDVAQYSGAKEPGSVGTLLEAGKRLDRDMLRDTATAIGDGVRVLAAPAEMMPIDDVDIDQLLRIVSYARREFDFVFVDLPSAWTNWSLSIAASSDEIFVVTKQGLGNLRHAHRCMRLFDDIGFDRDKVKLVINCASRSLFGGISTKDVEAALNRNAAGWLPRDDDNMTQAVDQGRLLSEIAPRSSYAKGIRSLAEQLADRLSGDVE